ncbi:MAG: hypothetical protein K5756_01035 [Clostridiales bacterium]|nr:hypothetical protein [Clostridiales bacterium]
MKIKRLISLIISVCILTATLSVGVSSAYTEVLPQGYSGDMTGVNYYEQLENDTQRAIYNALSGLTPSSSSSLSVNFIDLSNTSEDVLTDLVHNADLLSYKASANPVSDEERLAFQNNVVKASVQTAIDAFQSDHPEKFWIKFGEGGTTFKTTTFFNTDEANEAISNGDTYDIYLVRIRFTIVKKSEYTANPGANYTELQNAINSFPFNYNGGQYLLIKSIHDGIIQHTSLGIEGTAGDVYGALVSGYANAYGYSKAFKLLCDVQNIPCVIVYGSNVSNIGRKAHMWNYVYIENDWFMVDVSLDDLDSVAYTSTCYDYFLAGSNSVGTQYGYYPVSQSHLEDGDFSDSGYKTFTYPELSETRRDVDYTELVLALALEPRFPENYYTQESLDAFNTALENGRNVDRDLGRDEQYIIDNAVKAIKNAYNNLTLITPVNLEGLDDALLLTPEHPDTYYTVASITAFRDARETALAVAPVQSEIDAAEAQLRTAYANLVLFDFTALDEALALTPAYPDSHYTEVTRVAYREAYNHADNLVPVVQEDIDNAATALVSAYNALVLLDFTSLDTALALEPEFDESCYSAESLNDLKRARTEAAAFVPATQEDVEQCALNLTRIFNSLELIPMTVADGTGVSLDAKNKAIIVPEGTNLSNVMDWITFVPHNGVDPSTGVKTHSALTVSAVDGLSGTARTGIAAVNVYSDGSLYDTYYIVVCGDCDCDGIADGYDTIFVNMAIGEVMTLSNTPSYILRAADVNSDGVIDVIDANILFVAGMTF